MEAGTTGDAMLTAEIFAFAAVLVGILAGMMLEKFRVHVEAGETAPKQLVLSGPGSEGAGPLVRLPGNRAPAMTGAAQLRAVTDARFASQRLLSDTIQTLFAELETIIADLGQRWRVMAQVSLGEFIGSPDKQANDAIRDQRVDLLIVSARQLPIAAIEYQPLGQVHDDAAVHDAVKREALRRADVLYIQIRPSDGSDVLREHLRRLVAIQPVADTAAAAAPKRRRRNAGVNQSPAATPHRE